MEEIQNSILVFERLRQHIYQISIENGQVLLLRFSREHYHHLMGFQHLTDLESVSKPVSKQKFYGDVRRGKLRPEKMQKSAQYSRIRERITSFHMLEEILSEGDGKIIVEFDRRKNGSAIRAKFHLYRRSGDPFREEAAYYTLFIDRAPDGIYYPVTYIVEHSNRYLRNQNMLNCSIVHLPLREKKKTPAQVG